MTQVIKRQEELDLLAKKARELKEKRIEQYKRLNLFQRCKLICLKLGVCYPKKHGAWWVFKDSVLEIGYDDFAPNIYVLYKDKKVLEVHLGQLTLFRVGKWLDRVLEISNPLLKQEEQEEYLQRQRELLEEIDRWGEIEEDE